MLLKLTTQCSMECPHCMECASPKGEMMDYDTFTKAVLFGLFIGRDHFLLSGGEPTEHPDLLKWCEILSDTGTKFTIISNGMWLKNQDKVEDIKRISKLSGYLGMQVYTNKEWYKEYDFVVSNIDKYKAIDKVIPDIDSHIYMQDLGRAKQDQRALKQAEENPYFMPCLNATLVARQFAIPKQFGITLALRGQFCKPSVCTDGKVVMSECRFCKEVGNVNHDSPEDLWRKMKKFVPCGGCKGYKRFIESNRLDIKRAREVLGI